MDMISIPGYILPTSVASIMDMKLALKRIKVHLFWRDTFNNCEDRQRDILVRRFPSILFLKYQKSKPEKIMFIDDSI